MKLIELKNWINSLPEEFKHYDVVNSEEGDLTDGFTYRFDKPIIGFYEDEPNKEIVLLTDEIKKQQ